MKKLYTFALASAAIGWQTTTLAAAPVSDCDALTADIAADVMALPSSGAVIESAKLMPPSELKPANLPFGPLPPYMAVEPATPEYCQVVGAIQPVDAEAPEIRFQVNLPSDWNGSSLQFGGGGFNGVLITGLNLPPLALADSPSPLAQGFVTYGTDSGHQNKPDTPLQAFALNDEALENFAYASYKKVRDVAMHLINNYYGQEADKRYFVGLSEGGREGVTMAQRFPTGFDGIISGVPVINWVNLQTAGTRMGLALLENGWISPEKVQLVHDAVLNACDALDGLEDGVVSNYVACEKAFDVNTLACANNDDENCLNPGDIAVIKQLHNPSEIPFKVANGQQHYPGWGLSGEATAGTGPVGGWVAWQTGETAPELPPQPGNSRAWLYGSGAVQYFFAQDPDYDVTQFDPEALKERMKIVSELMDSTNPDLSEFSKHGGKLIVFENMADYAQSPYAGIEYVQAVKDTLGDEQTEQFLRLYVNPGTDHMGGGAPAAVNFLDALTSWVEHDNAPGNLVAAQQDNKAPFSITAERPLCQYPEYPHYVGGDEAKAESFECRKP